MTSTTRTLGPYRLGLLLGKGGMGEVYKAYDDRLERFVAIKKMRGAASSGQRERFRREAQMLAQLGHPGIVQVFDLLTDDAGDWIVMELIDGPTLAELCRSRPLLPSLAIDYARQIASVLDSAHESGIIHRDLKTENVMVLPSGHIKVLDFGLARQAAPNLDKSSEARRSREEYRRSSELQSNRIVGTPRSMSPEQILGWRVGPRSDLFSLGVLLYEILTARSPFAGSSIAETLRRVLDHTPPAIRRLNPRVPEAFSLLVDRLLQKDPDFRPGSVSEVEEQLSKLLDGSPPKPNHGDLSQIETLTSTGTTDLWSDPASTSITLDHDTVVVATLVASVLVNSTHILNELGDHRAAWLFRHHDRVAKSLLREHAGREIDKTDGFLLLFDRPWNAVAYATSFHRALGELGLKARVGIHLGEIVLHRNSEEDVRRGAKPLEVEGLAKPTAARLTSLALDGQTLLTRAAYEVARRGSAEGPGHDLDLQWQRHGLYRFQGLGDVVEVFEVGPRGSAPLLPPVDSKRAYRIGPSPPTSILRAPSGQEQGPLAGDSSCGAVTLRIWPPPQIPAQPYPVLMPYTHPGFLAGRDGEISQLRRMLDMEIPILGLSAPSGTGKSSLLLGGLVPELRSEGTPVALARHPAEAGLPARLISDLLAGAALPAEGETESFVERLVEVERLAGTAPILVLDQFEDVLKPESGAAREVLGLMMASSLVRHPGVCAAPCRWLIAYRREFHGRLRSWLSDVLRESRAANRTTIGLLPHDLSGPERFHRMALAPLAAPAAAVESSFETSKKVFLAAIEVPLTHSSFLESEDERQVGAGSTRRYRWSFADGHADRLAETFALARQSQPDAPLVPELQVVLAHLVAQAAPDGRLSVPENTEGLIDQALENHLRRALERTFPADRADARAQRSRALLTLRELADASDRQNGGLGSEQLARAFGEGGEAILEQLATPLTRLVWLRETPQGLRWTLSHDRLAEPVVKLVDEDGQLGRLLFDEELLALRRFVTLRAEVFRSGQKDLSTRISKRHYRKISNHAHALLVDDERRAWFTACRDRRRSDRLRLALLGSAALAVLLVAGLAAWTRAEQQVERKQRHGQVVKAKPQEALKALYMLSLEPGARDSELLALLRQREVPTDVLGSGLGGLEEPQRSAAVLRIVEIALPWVDQTPEDPLLIATLVWALDFAPSRNSATTEKAQALRNQVLSPLRRSRPPPPQPELTDPDWIHVPPGSFLMGTPDGKEGSESERPQHEVQVATFRMLRHEVTVGQYRRLFPRYQPQDDEDLPAAYVTWQAAYTYAAWLDGRLPTEAEWEYAARAGCAFAYCSRRGTETTVDAVAWTLRNSRDPIYNEPVPHPVMSLEPNPWGFYDMLGNLVEWTADAFADYPQGPRIDAWGPAVAEASRVGRGGSYWDGAQGARVASREMLAAASGSGFHGFRVVLPDRFERP